MLHSFKTLTFKFPWRSYQEKLLSNFEIHIEDNHFHVIAPPGSGKTILGIEILRRLGKKTLVLAPTLTIRNQWENRLQAFFADGEPFKNVSFDIKAPNDITFSTYQSLHSFYKSFEDKTAYFEFFKNNQIEVVVLDEAHHLKNAWWQCLMALKESNAFTVVALTATPPYDSTQAEVNKYFKLCGEVDDEISVPELIRESDLSPHQDFVYFSQPYNSELNFIKDFRSNITDFKEVLLQDEDFIAFLESHRFYENPKLYRDEIYNNTTYFSSILITLSEVGVYIKREKLVLLGFNEYDNVSFPKLDLYWLEILFQNVLVTDRDNLEAHEVYLKQLEKKLKQLHVFEKNRVNLLGDEWLYKSLAFSPSKLESIAEIVSAERFSLKDDLSCVILTDYVRKEFLNTQDDEVDHINKIGVLPIFHYLRTSAVENEDVAILTGSVVVIHKSVVGSFKKDDVANQFWFSPLKADENFVEVRSSSSSNKTIVNRITKLFEEGIIKVLIGTKALLGEGWDAPSINSLILASFVGSFVSSNQMRGRAIRKDANKPNKTSNIWHLACLDPTDKHGGREIQLLKRRFEAFVGVTNTKVPFIMNGYDRLELPEYFDADTLNELNTSTMERASKREKTSGQWTRSIGEGSKLARQLQFQHFDETPMEEQRQAYFAKASQIVVIELILVFLVLFSGTIATLIGWASYQKFSPILNLVFSVLLIYLGYKLYQVIRDYFRYGFLHKHIENMGLVILHTMDEMHFLTTKMDVLEVNTEKLPNSAIICSLKGATNYESTLFTNALAELLGPMHSPRYLIVKANLMQKQLNAEQFFAVPESFGKNKKDAQLFYKYWLRFMGMGKLVFTRQPEGRRLLLKARLFHHSNDSEESIETITVWE